MDQHGNLPKNTENEGNDAPNASRRRFLSRVAKVGVAAAIPASYGYWIEPDHFGVAELEIRIPDWPKAASGVRIGHLSDVHCDSDSEVDRASRAAKLLLAQKPDVVFLTGD